MYVVERVSEPISHDDVAVDDEQEAGAKYETIGTVWLKTMEMVLVEITKRSGALGKARVGLINHIYGIFETSLTFRRLGAENYVEPLVERVPVRRLDVVPGILKIKSA
jgi:hypothetical protein